MSRPGKVSLSGSTRLSAREAQALLDAACRGQAEIEMVSDEVHRHLPDHVEAGLNKLKTAMNAAGHYDTEGHVLNLLPDPTIEERRRNHAETAKATRHSPEDDE